MKYKAYIIKRYNQSSNDYQKVEGLYLYGKNLYLNSTHKLSQGMSIESYYDDSILINKPDFVPNDYVSDVLRWALKDHETKSIKKMGYNGSIKLQIYTSDVEFYRDYFLISNINLSVKFNYIQNIKNMHSFAIKRINDDEYELIVEVSIDLTGLNKVYHYDGLQVASDLNIKESPSIYICIRDFDYIDEKSTIYIENRNNYNKKFDAFQSLINRQNEFSYNLTKAANIISQMRETIY